MNDRAAPGRLTEPPAHHPATQLTRRRFLKASVAASMATAAIALTGCTTSSASSSSTTTSERPRRGGTLRAGLTGGGSSDTLDPDSGVTLVDFARSAQLYDPLLKLQPNVQDIGYMLAEEFSPNKSATVWTVRLRKGVTFHDGKPLTADDVLYTIRRITNPKSPLAGSTSFTPVDVSAIKKRDKWTLELPCHHPYSILDQTLAGYYQFFNIVPEHFRPHQHPNGTGPFKYQAFSPGVKSTTIRNDNYWANGRPYLNEIQTINFADETSQVNALVSGTVDLIDNLSIGSVSAVVSGGQVVHKYKSGLWTPFTMRVDTPPFSDVRVRQAMRWLVDREEMMKLTVGPAGLIGNDIFSIFDRDYDHSIHQREQDISRAKSLLRQAGQSNLTVQLVTGPIATGVVEAAQVFAQQASQAGVHVNIRQLTAGDFYGPEYLKYPFAQDYWNYSEYLAQVTQSTLPTSVYNETHFNDAHYNKLYRDGLRATDPTARRDIVYEMQRIDWQDGGYIIPYFLPLIDASATNVHGIVPAEFGFPLSNFAFTEFWLS